MTPLTLETCLEFLRTQYVFWIIVYEVMILGLKNKLQSLTKRGLEKRVQLRHNDIKITLEDGKSDDPKISITQKLANASDLRLRVSKVEILLKSDNKEIDKFYYRPPESVLDYGAKIKFSTTDPVIEPLDLNWLVHCESSKLSQAMPNCHGKEIMVSVNGIIELSTKTTKIEKTIKRNETLVIEAKRPKPLIS